MRPDPTYKTIFGHAFMVEELMRWLVADLHGARELVDALDFSGLLRVHEQSVASGGSALRGYANDMSTTSTWSVGAAGGSPRGVVWRRCDAPCDMLKRATEAQRRTNGRDSSAAG